MGLPLEEVADAFGALAEGDPDTLIALLHPQVAWLEYLGPRRSTGLDGVDVVARVLRDRVRDCRCLGLTGITKGDDWIDVGYSEPWWLERRGLGAHVAYYLLGDAHQTVSVGDRIDAIASHASYFTPRAFEAADPAERELLRLLRR